jgi:hypothetical protein
VCGDGGAYQASTARALSHRSIGSRGGTGGECWAPAVVATFAARYDRRLLPTQQSKSVRIPAQVLAG